MTTSRILLVLMLTAAVVSGQTAMKYDNYTHAVNKPPVSAGSAYDYDFTGLNLHGISIPITPGGSPTQFQYNNAGALGGVPVYTYNGTTVTAQADNVIYAQSSAPTARFHFDGSGISGGANRSVNIPDANSTTAQGISSVSHQFLKSMSAQGVFTQGQPTGSDIAAGTISGSTFDSGTVSNSSLASSNTYVMLDGLNTLIENATDPTKRVKWNLANITGGSTWSITAPDANSTLVIPDTGASNNFLTGISNLGVITKAQPSAANLSNGTTGSGSVVLATSPALVTPDIGTPSAGVVTNLTGTGAFSTTGAAQKISFSGQTGLMNFTGLSSTNRQKTVRDAADTILELGGSYTPTGTWTNMILAGLTSSGSNAIDFSGNSGAFKTSSGANQLSGAVTISDATTPSLTTASGKTNTGFVQINGKTSGALKITAADAAAQTVTLNLAAQTSGAATLSIPDQVGTNRNIVTDTGTQTLTNKTFTGSTDTIDDATTVNHDLTAVPNQTGGWTEYFVTGIDYTTTATTAGTDITGLTSGTLSNSTVYEFEYTIRLLNAADSTGMKLALHCGGTGTAGTVFSTFYGNGGSSTNGSAASINAVDTLGTAIVTYSAGEGIVTGSGFFKTTSTGTATFSIQLAKVTSGTATCRVGSVLRIRKAHT